MSILLLVGTQTLSLSFRRRSHTSEAALTLAASFILFAGLILFEFRAQFVPAMYEDQQIRQATFIAHIKLVALESIILPLALTSSTSRSECGKLYFWSGWLLNLIPLAVISYMKAYGRLFCC